jgi:serine/threonine protein kinase/WD40 repeat protein
MVQEVPMSDAASEHPGQEQLEAFGLGRLDEEDAARVLAHLEKCGDCRGLVASVPDDTLSSLVRASATPADATEGVDSSSFVIDTAEPDFLAGHPRYRVLGLVGIGGMGVVYRAQHLLMDRVVALKVIHRQLVDRPGASERFRREVKAAAGLAHPNVVAAYDAEQVGDRHFLVMEYVPGVTLTQLVKEQGPLPPAQACDYIRQAALGLQHAHERGMVHRDIKPHNLMVSVVRGPSSVVKDTTMSVVRCPSSVVKDRTKDAAPFLTPDHGERTTDVIKILDFGLARLGQEPAGDLTYSGTVMGSADFLAPEQADDPHRADIRADIYSLGCTLFFLLTGKPPFSDGTFTQKLKAHALRKPPPLAALRPDLPAGLEQVVQRLLAKEPSERFQTPAEVAEALAPFAAGSPGVEKARRSLWRSLAVAAAGLVLMLAALIAYRISTDNGDILIETDDPDVEVIVKQDEKLVTILDGKTRQKVTLHTGEYTLSLAGDADGLKMDLPPTFVLRRGDKKVVIIRRPPPGEITRWQAHSGYTALAMDTTGKTLASGGPDGDIKLWSAADGKLLRDWNGHSGSVFQLTFSPDGKMLASGGGGDWLVKWWDAAGGTLRGTFEGHNEQIRGLAFAADGKTLFTGGAHMLCRIDLETSKGKVLNTFDKWIRSIALAGDNRTLAVATWPDAKAPFKLRFWDAVEEKEVLQIDIPSRVTNCLAFDPKSRAVAVGGDEPPVLGLWDLSGKAKVTMTGLKQPVMAVAFSRDGKLLVSAGGVWNRTKETGEIKVWDVATGKELAALGSNLDCAFAVVVAADGKTCFTSHHDGTIRKWRLPPYPNHGAVEIIGNDPDVQVVWSKMASSSRSSICEKRPARLCPRANTPSRRTPRAAPSRWNRAASS